MHTAAARGAAAAAEIPRGRKKRVSRWSLAAAIASLPATLWPAGRRPPSPNCLLPGPRFRAGDPPRLLTTNRPASAFFLPSPAPHQTLAGNATALALPVAARLRHWLLSVSFLQSHNGPNRQEVMGAKHEDLSTRGWLSSLKRRPCHNPHCLSCSL